VRRRRLSTAQELPQHAPDPLLAARHLNHLILSMPLNEAMFAVRDHHDGGALDRWAGEAVREWPAAYGA
jgi:hypothetical protein